MNRNEAMELASVLQIKFKLILLLANKQWKKKKISSALMIGLMQVHAQHFYILRERTYRLKTNNNFQSSQNKTKQRKDESEKKTSRYQTQNNALLKYINWIINRWSSLNELKWIRTTRDNDALIARERKNEKEQKSMWISMNISMNTLRATKKHELILFCFESKKTISYAKLRPH